MAMYDESITIQLTAETQDVKAKLSDVQKDIDKISNTQKAISNFSKLGIAIGATAVALKKVVAISKDLVNNYKVQEQNLVKLDSVNKAIGQSIGKTTEQLAKQASELQENSTFGDEMILSAQQTLIAVGNLSREGFDRAIQASADLASAMGEDVTQASQTLSMALIDPEQGLRRLRTAGIAFTDEEKEQIKTLVDNGKAQEAQAKILDKVEQKYKGIAKAITDVPTGKMEQVANVWSDIKESLGGALVNTLSPIIDDIYEKLKKLSGWAEKLNQGTSVFSTARSGKDLTNYSVEELQAGLEEVNRRRAMGSQYNVGAYILYDSIEKDIQDALKKAYERKKWEAMTKHYASQVIPSATTPAKPETPLSDKVAGFMDANGIKDARAELQAFIKDGKYVLALMEDEGQSGTRNYALIAQAIEDATNELGNMGESSAETAEKVKYTWQEALNDIANSILSTLSMITDSTNAQIDRQIEAIDREKEARLETNTLTQEQEKELDRERQKLEKQKFEAEKRNKIAEILIQGGLGVAKAFADYGWPWGMIPASIITAQTAVQTALVSSQQYQGYERGGIVGGSGITGDNHLIMANAGELILTKAQQGIIASQLQGGGSAPVIEVNFTGQVFGDQRTISEYVYDGIKTAQMQGDLRQW